MLYINNNSIFLLVLLIIIMVSLIGLAATVTTGSIVFRKLYEYYWKNPNVIILL